MHVERYRTSGAVADALGIARWQLAFLIERGIVPDASLRVPGRRLFNDEDVTRIRRALANHTNTTKK